MRYDDRLLMTQTACGIPSIDSALAEYLTNPPSSQQHQAYVARLREVIGSTLLLSYQQPN